MTKLPVKKVETTNHYTLPSLMIKRVMVKKVKNSQKT